ncbi:MAG: acyl-CoA dehydrogenase family protein [Gammaproteobacteria bacterium]
MDFSLPAELLDLETRVREFVASEVMPLESDPGWTAHGPTPALVAELQARGKAAGLWSLHAPARYGGGGLDHVGRAVVLEAAGYSLLGPIALNVMPGEGDHHMLDAIASEEQKRRWLEPLIDGTARSTFCVTEPDNGAGADPNRMQTVAVPDGDDYLISGRKWMITTYGDAAFHIVMAQTRDAAGKDIGATMFVVDAGAAGLAEVRELDMLDDMFPGGHSEISFDEVRVSPDRILGEPGKGFRYAQVRLCPARLTHCMRWLGAAQRAHDAAVRHARWREAFGKPIGQHQGVSFQLADNLMDLHHCRLAVRHAAWLLDQGQEAREETSMCKVYCSEKLGAVVDRALQVFGGMGTSTDYPVMRIYKNVRAFRLYDGPSEVHRWALARRLLAAEA